MTDRTFDGSDDTHDDMDTRGITVPVGIEEEGDVPSAPIAPPGTTGEPDLHPPTRSTLAASDPATPSSRPPDDPYEVGGTAATPGWSGRAMVRASVILRWMRSCSVTPTVVEFSSSPNSPSAQGRARKRRGRRHSRRWSRSRSSGLEDQRFLGIGFIDVGVWLIEDGELLGDVRLVGVRRRPDRAISPLLPKRWTEDSWIWTRHSAMQEKRPPAQEWCSLPQVRYSPTTT